VNSIRPKQYIHNTGNLVTQKFKKKLAEGCEYDYERGGTILVLSLTELKASPGPFGDMMQFQFLIPVMWPVSECLVHDRCDLQITMIPLGMIVISSQPCWPTSNPTSTLPSSDIAIAIRLYPGPCHFRRFSWSVLNILVSVKGKEPVEFFLRIPFAGYIHEMRFEIVAKCSTTKARVSRMILGRQCSFLNL
jgi:hypothetical protein